jgi:hypothetical protein
MAAPAVNRRPMRKFRLNRPPGQAPSLPMLVLPIAILGGLAMLHLAALAQLSRLEAESRRLDRLCLEQTARAGELRGQWEALVSQSALQPTVQRVGLVPAGAAQAIVVGALPPPKIYWHLPDEVRPMDTDGQRLGQVAPNPAQRTRNSL